MRLNKKEDNIRALETGYFGNAPKQWQTVAEAWEEVGAHGAIVARPRVRGGQCVYDTTPHKMLFCPLDERDFYYNEPIDPDTVLLNAEVMNAPGGPHLFYSTKKMHMRPALRTSGQHASGAKALTIMRHLCCGRGFDVIMELLTMYPDHVVEFTCMSRAYGTLGWHTVIWECRNY